MNDDTGRPVKPHRSGGGLPQPPAESPLPNYTREKDLIDPLKNLAFSLHRRTDERAADLIDAAIEQICTTRQIAELFLTGPEGQKLVISSELEARPDNSFCFTVTDPKSARRWGIVAGITELVPNG